jgi:tetratricopeptide (TPR) repeat protein
MAFLAGLGDGAGLARERMTELADLAGTIPSREFWRPLYEALAHYRAGNFERVLQILDANAQLDTLEKAQCLRALALFRSGRTEEARRVLQTAGDRYAAYSREVLSAREFRVAPRLWWELAELQILYREAREVVDGRKSGIDPTTETLAARAWDFWEKRDPATRDFDDTVRASPTSQAAWMARARRFTQLNQPGKAAADYLKALSLAPADEATRREFEKVLSSLGDPGEALAHLAEASGLKPDQPQYWLERGRFWRGLEKPDLAAADFSRALDLFPPPTEWETSNWGAARTKAEYEIAADREVFERLAAIRPDDVHLRLTGAQRHAMFGRWKRALDGFAPLIEELSPGDEWAEYAVLLWLTNDRAGYSAFLAKMAARLDPDAGWFNGYVMARAALPAETRVIDPERLVAAMELAVKSDPGPWYLHVSGLALLEARRVSEAIDRFNQSRRDSRWGQQSHAQNELGLALASAQQNDFTGATRWFDQAVAHIGTGAPEVWPLDWIYLAVLRRLAQEKIVGHDIDLITEQLAREPKNPEARLKRRADLHARLHHWQAAAADYRRLSELNDRDDAVCRKEALMHAQERRWADAAQAMRRSLNLKPDLEQHLYSMVLLALLAHGDDPAAYHRACGELVALVAETGDPNVAERVAKGALILPLSPQNREAVFRLASRSVTLDPKSPVLPWAMAGRALAAYRHGGDDDALVWAERCLTADLASPVWYRAAQAQLVVAMTRERMGQHDAARSALARAAALIQPTTDRYEAAGEMDEGWFNWLIPTLLMREAQSLIEPVQHSPCFRSRLARPRQQFAERGCRNGFDEMLVESGGERLLAVFFLSPSGDGNEERRLELRYRPQPPGQLVAVHPGHPDVEQEYIRVEARGHIKGLLAAAGHVTLVPAR